MFVARILGLTITLAALSACGTSQPTKYYLLSGTAPDTVNASVPRTLTVGVGPLLLPPYLQRREMVSLASDNELHVAVYHQWGEPLADNISRVMGNDLARLLATERIIRLPVKRSLRAALNIDYQVTVAISQFEKNTQGVVVLDARWAILDKDKNELMLQRSEYMETPVTDDHAGQAAAQSRVLGRLGEAIATAIVKLADHPAP